MAVLRSLAGRAPAVAPSAYIADGAVLIGAVTVHDGASIWFNAVLRADSEPIVIGRETNVQDTATLHVDPGLPCLIGNGVTIGHGAVVHACTVEDNVLIGMHATILSGAVVGRDTIIGAGALVTENARIPPGSLVLGIPGRVVRALRPEEITSIRRSAESYVQRAQLYRRELQ
ncbi:MAG TPA: gamma carbonic anhydrase family protein [Streptosporangiaceae bacterium]|nr:gamma carbonic anhydrase family protein [Streptosporangiaceae bacterium]